MQRCQKKRHEWVNFTFSWHGGSLQWYNLLWKYINDTICKWLFSIIRPSIQTFGEVSQPCSPTRQLKWIRKHRENVELHPDDLEKYVKFLKSNEGLFGLKGIPKSQIARIKSKLNKKWLTNIMLKRKVAQIGDEIMDNHV